MSKKKTKKKITRADRIERQIALLYKAVNDHRATEYDLGLTANRMMERIYQLCRLLEDGK